MFKKKKYCYEHTVDFTSSSCKLKNKCIPTPRKVFLLKHSDKSKFGAEHKGTKKKISPRAKLCNCFKKQTRTQKMCNAAIWLSSYYINASTLSPPPEPAHTHASDQMALLMFPAQRIYTRHPGSQGGFFFIYIF